MCWAASRSQPLRRGATCGSDPARLTHRQNRRPRMLIRGRLRSRRGQIRSSQTGAPAARHRRQASCGAGGQAGQTRSCCALHTRTRGGRKAHRRAIGGLVAAALTRVGAKAAPGWRRLQAERAGRTERRITRTVAGARRRSRMARLLTYVTHRGSGLDARRPAGRDRSAGGARGDGYETAHGPCPANPGPVLTPR